MEKGEVESIGSRNSQSLSVNFIHDSHFGSLLIPCRYEVVNFYSIPETDNEFSLFRLITISLARNRIFFAIHNEPLSQ